MSSESKGRFVYRGSATARSHIEFVIDAIGTVYLFPPTHYPSVGIAPTTATTTTPASPVPVSPPATPASPLAITSTAGTTTSLHAPNPTATFSLVPATGTGTGTGTTALVVPSFTARPSFSPFYTAAVALPSPLCFALANSDIKYDLTPLPAVRDSTATVWSYVTALASPSGWREWLTDGIIGVRLTESFVHVLSPVLCDRCVRPFVLRVIHSLPAMWKQYSTVQRHEKTLSDAQRLKEAYLAAQIQSQLSEKAGLEQLTKSFDARFAAEQAKWEERIRAAESKAADLNRHHTKQKAEAIAETERELERVRAAAAKSAADAAKATTAAAKASHAAAAAEQDRKRMESQFQQQLATKTSDAEKLAAERDRIKRELQSAKETAAATSAGAAALNAALQQKEAELKASRIAAANANAAAVSATANAASAQAAAQAAAAAAAEQKRLEAVVAALEKEKEQLIESNEKFVAEKEAKLVRLFSDASHYLCLCCRLPSRSLMN